MPLKAQLSSGPVIEKQTNKNKKMENVLYSTNMYTYMPKQMWIIVSKGL